MHSRILSFVVSLMLLLSAVMASPPAIATPDRHPTAELSASGHATAELPAPDAAGHDPAESLLDIPDQLEGPRASHDAPPRAGSVEPGAAASLTHPHLEGPQRPPRAADRRA